MTQAESRGLVWDGGLEVTADEDAVRVGVEAPLRVQQRVVLPQLEALARGKHLKHPHARVHARDRARIRESTAIVTMRTQRQPSQVS